MKIPNYFNSGNSLNNKRLVFNNGDAEAPGEGTVGRMFAMNTVEELRPVDSAKEIYQDIKALRVDFAAPPTANEQERLDQIIAKYGFVLPPPVPPLTQQGQVLNSLYDRLEAIVPPERRQRLLDLLQPRDLPTYANALATLAPGGGPGLVSRNVLSLINELQVDSGNITNVVREQKRLAELQKVLEARKEQLRNINQRISQNDQAIEQLNQVKDSWTQWTMNNVVKPGLKWGLRLTAIGMGIGSMWGAWGALAPIAGQSISLSGLASGVWQGFSYIPSCLGSGFASLAQKLGLSTFGLAGRTAIGAVGARLGLKYTEYLTKRGAYAVRGGLQRAERGIRKTWLDLGINRRQAEVDELETEIRELKAVNETRLQTIQTELRSFEDERDRLLTVIQTAAEGVNLDDQNARLADVLEVIDSLQSIRLLLIGGSRPETIDISTAEIPANANAAADLIIDMVDEMDLQPGRDKELKRLSKQVDSDQIEPIRGLAQKNYDTEVRNIFGEGQNANPITDPALLVALQAFLANINDTNRRVPDNLSQLAHSHSGLYRIIENMAAFSPQHSYRQRLTNLLTPLVNQAITSLNLRPLRESALASFDRLDAESLRTPLETNPLAIATYVNAALGAAALPIPMGNASNDFRYWVNNDLNQVQLNTLIQALADIRINCIYDRNLNALQDVLVGLRANLQLARNNLSDNLQNYIDTMTPQTAIAAAAAKFTPPIDIGDLTFPQANQDWATNLPLLTNRNHMQTILTVLQRMNSDCLLFDENTNELKTFAEVTDPINPAATRAAIKREPQLVIYYANTLTPPPAPQLPVPPVGTANSLKAYARTITNDEAARLLEVLTILENEEHGVNTAGNNLETIEQQLKGSITYYLVTLIDPLFPGPPITHAEFMEYCNDLRNPGENVPLIPNVLAGSSLIWNIQNRIHDDNDQLRLILDYCQRIYADLTP